MTAKTHIVDSVEPLDKHYDLKARCGKVLDGDPIFMWDEQEMGEPLNLPLGICRKCLKVDDPKLRYSYGVKV